MVEPLIKNDAVVLGILFIILALVFISSNSKNRWLLKFYKYVPSLLLCYFIPSILNSMGIISGDHSNLYFALVIKLFYNLLLSNLALQY